MQGASDDGLPELYKRHLRGQIKWGAAPITFPLPPAFVQVRYTRYKFTILVRYTGPRKGPISHPWYTYSWRHPPDPTSSPNLTSPNLSDLPTHPVRH